MKRDTANEISTIELAKFGAIDLAYIRPVQLENTDQCMLFAGDERELDSAPTFLSACLAALGNNFKPVSVH